MSMGFISAQRLVRRFPQASGAGELTVFEDVCFSVAEGEFVMTNGPKAWIAEVIENTLPADRARIELHKHPNYYPLRNHLMDFLVTRSRELAARADMRCKDLHPAVVRPAVATPTSHAAAGVAAQRSGLASGGQVASGHICAVQPCVP